MKSFLSQKTAKKNGFSDNCLYNAECLTLNDKYVRIMFKNEKPIQAISIDVNGRKSPNLTIEAAPHEDLKQIWPVLQNDPNNGNGKWWKGSLSEGSDVVDTSSEEQRRSWSNEALDLR